MTMKKNSNLKVRSLWIGKELSPIEMLSINSYLNNGHSFELYVYDRIGNLPQGVILRDANRVIPKSGIFTMSLGAHINSVAIFADLFRYKLLYNIGGWWVDLDTVCIKHYDFQQEYVFAREKTANQREIITNGIIKSPKSASIMKHCYDATKEMIQGKGDLIWGQTGPALLEKAVTTFNLTNYGIPSDLLMPFGYFEIEKIFLEEKLPDNSYSLHLYNSTWIIKDYPKFGHFEKNSLFEILKCRYGIKNNLLRFVLELLIDIKNNRNRKGLKKVLKKIKYGYHFW